MGTFKKKFKENTKNKKTKSGTNYRARVVSEIPKRTQLEGKTTFTDKYGNTYNYQTPEEFLQHCWTTDAGKHYRFKQINSGKIAANATIGEPCGEESSVPAQPVKFTPQQQEEIEKSREATPQEATAARSYESPSTSSQELSPSVIESIEEKLIELYNIEKDITVQLKEAMEPIKKISERLENDVDGKVTEQHIDDAINEARDKWNASYCSVESRSWSNRFLPTCDNPIGKSISNIGLCMGNKDENPMESYRPCNRYTSPEAVAAGAAAASVGYLAAPALAATAAIGSTATALGAFGATGTAVHYATKSEAASKGRATDKDTL